MPLPIKVAFIGLSTKGFASTHLAPSLTIQSLRSKYNLVALATSSEASAQAAASHWSTAVGHEVKGYSSSKKLLEAIERKEVDVDLVYLSLPPTADKDAVIPFIRAKKDFIVEWPVGKDQDETKEIADEARRFGVRSLIGFQARQSPVINKVKQIISSGKIGKVVSTNFVALVPAELLSAPPITASNQAYRLDKSNGITLLSIPVAHHLDTFSTLFGPFTSISATGTQAFPTSTIVDPLTGQPTGEILPAPAGVPDQITVTGLCKYDDSPVLVTITWRSGVPGTTPGRVKLWWEIDGTEGSLRLANDEQLVGGITNVLEPQLLLNGDKVEVDLWGDGEGNAVVDEAEATAVGGGFGPGIIGMLIRNWLEFAKGEEEGRYATMDDAVRMRRVLSCIEESLETGRRVTV